MANLGVLTAFLKANNTDFKQGIGGAKKSLLNFKTVAVAGFAAATAAMVKFGVDSLKAFQVQERAERKRQAVLKATGFAAGLTSRELTQMADNMADAFNMPDENIVDLQAKMLSFKNIGKDTFQDVLTAAIDMSKVMDQSATSSVIQLGKAINDPIKGMTALTRVGVTFTEEQREQVRALQESGDLLGAQKIVLAELQSEFGGAAEEMADANLWGDIMNVWGDLKEAIGEVLAIFFNLGENSETIADKLRTVVSAIKENAVAAATFAKSLWIELKFAFLQSWSAAKTFFGGIIELMMQIIKFFKNNFVQIFINLVDVLKNVWGQLKNIITGKQTGLDLANIIMDAVKNIEPPDLSSVKFLDIDEIQRLDKERAKAQADLMTASIKRVSDEAKRDADELKKVTTKKPPQDTVKTEMEVNEKQFVGAFQSDSLDAYKLIIRSGEKGIDVQKKIAQNTQQLVRLQQEANAKNKTVEIGMTDGRTT